MMSTIEREKNARGNLDSEHAEIGEKAHFDWENAEVVVIEEQLWIMPNFTLLYFFWEHFWYCDSLLAATNLVTKRKFHYTPLIRKQFREGTSMLKSPLDCSCTCQCRHVPHGVWKDLELIVRYSKRFEKIQISD